MVRSHQFLRGGCCALGHVRVMGDHQQDVDDHPVRDQGGSALRHERCRQARQGQQTGDAADDREHLQCKGEGQPARQELAETVRADQRGLHAPGDDEPQKEPVRYVGAPAHFPVPDVRSQIDCPYQKMKLKIK